MRHRSPVVLVALALGCATAVTDDSGALLEPQPVQANRLRDGIWRGNFKQGPNRAIVEIAVDAGRIRDVRIVQHKAWKGVAAEEPVTQQIVERQSTQVDVVSGASNSSVVLMKATQAAVERAYGDRK